MNDKPLPPSTTVETSPSSAVEAKRCLPSDDDDDSDDGDETASKKAKVSAAPLKKPNIVEENLLLLELKDDKSMKWPEIAEVFRQQGWIGRKVGLLKNRYKSLKDGTVFWEDDDVGWNLPNLELVVANSLCMGGG